MSLDDGAIVVACTPLQLSVLCCRVESEEVSGSYDDCLPVICACLLQLYALRTLSPATMDMVTKGAGWSVVGGCISLYNKFAAFLGNDVKVNAKLTATRSRGGVIKVRSLHALQLLKFCLCA